MKVFGVSFDSVDDNAAFAAKFEFPFPLLCDETKAIGLAYGAADSPDAGYPNRITYVIGADGTIEQAIATADPGAQAAEILAGLAGD